jgi:hypothetical protein
MKNSLLSPPYIFLRLTFLVTPLQAEDHQPGRPGTVNYVEGKAYIGSQSLEGKSVGTVELDPGETLSTQDGKVEILLTPGVFVRLGDRGSARIIGSRLTNTQMSIDQGEAEGLVLGHLQSAIPGQRAAQRRWEFTSMPGQCRDHHRRVFAGHFEQRCKTRMPLH